MTEKKLLAAAKAGNVDRIFALAGLDLDADHHDEEADDDAAIVAFKWLLVAGDFGHDVDDMLDVLQTGTSLHHDDEQAVEGSIHFELGVAYLRGEDGLAIDHELAREHLEWAHKLAL